MPGESTAWGLEFHLHDGTALVQLAGVFEVAAPPDEWGTADKTHFKSPGRRREYIKTLIDGGSIDAKMWYVAGSATDILCRAAFADVGSRAYKMVIPDEDGAGAWEIEGTLLATAYTRELPIDGGMAAILKVQFTGAQTEAAA